MSEPIQRIPAIGVLLETEEARVLCEAVGRDLAVHALRTAASQARTSTDPGACEPASILRSAAALAGAIARPSLRRVINATGVVLHTNLGRAPLGARVLEELAPIVLGYSNVEFDLEEGGRGHRVSHVRQLLTFLTGAEDAVVVNNNAAAIILVLHHFAPGKNVIVSRGELIEIGGSFRIPDIMAAGGARMVEVGTTNKTRIDDYAKAITAETAMLFKAHKSNYAIHGFTEEPTAAELAELAHRHKILFVYDLGSGLLRKPRGMRLEQEPDVRSALADGADLVTFSGDKVVGGPQAGIVVGSRALIKQLATDPLMRALRVGKLTLAALAAASRNYLTDKSLVRDNPTFAMLEQPLGVIEARASALRARLDSLGVPCSIRESSGATGGGALPDLVVPSRSVALKLDKQRSQTAHRRLMVHDTSVVGMLREGELWFDLLTVADDELESLAATIVDVITHLPVTTRPQEEP